ncbi:cupin domain-containing protein [Pseudogemmobacter bohemicus]|uniref:hypothetical protein n=1 Tax=Pseudogemmobacter bohemicus TaxID=2250708 RepID=UPI000DD4DAB7|nr:hypothetical protein [Pseudogemmobacter bohemicus]
MYDTTDPRSKLTGKPAAAATAAGAGFADADLGLFCETAPQIEAPGTRTWITRGQNFLVAHSETQPGAVLERSAQPDEYALILFSPDTPAIITAGGERAEVPGHSLVFIPPGDSRVGLPVGGKVQRVFSCVQNDLSALASNAASFVTRRPQIPAWQPWPAPKDGWRIRSYSLDVAPQPGRFGRIFRCSTLMINIIDPQVGPRDITRLSPHHHDDFEQGSLALEGSFVHHMRWPWTVNMNDWREDRHPLCHAPSLTVIPAPAIHTSRGVGQGVNQLIDIFAPPREDFSNQPGWVLNADDYPMPT